jgi:oxaloacetate decarboxylase alpha subunit
MEKNQKLRITDTTLRDAHQSLWATRMRTSDILGIIDTVDQAGYYSLEVWGCATFDVCMRFLRENPWERLREIKKRAKTPLQMLLRGQNVVGYKNYPDDLLDKFIELAVNNGMDIFRIFDALNDTRNLESAIASVKKHGGHAQGTISYTISPVHTVEKYMEYVREQAQLGIDSLVIKDMAGMLSPSMSGSLVSAIKKEFDLPVQIHCHATSGMSETAYLEGVKAGAGAIDTAVASMSGFSSQPSVETIHAIFTGLGYDTGLNMDAIKEIDKYFEKLSPLRTKPKGHEAPIDAGILVHQIPGGMISNFRSQLEQQDALDKLPEALDEVSKVRKDLGYPPLVTPTSQIVGTQAVMNVLAGERYKLVPQEVKNYVKGMYGKSPAPIEKDFIEKILGDEKPITSRPADSLKPMLPDATKAISQPELIHEEEDIISYCIFPEVAMEYFKWRALPEGQRPPIPADLEMQEVLAKQSNNGNSSKAADVLEDKLLHQEDIDGINSILHTASAMDLSELVITKGDFSLTLSGNGATGPATAKPRVLQPTASKGTTSEATKKQPEVKVTETLVAGETINAVMAGTFYRSASESEPPFVQEGQTVEAGQTVFILEAMKLFNEIKTPFKCKVLKILTENGQKVTKGQPVLEVEKL